MNAEFGISRLMMFYLVKFPRKRKDKLSLMMRLIDVDDGP